MKHPVNNSPRLGIVGKPLEHSLSPQIFQILSEKLNQPLTYERLEMGEAKIERWLKQKSNKAAFYGWNVTLPYKEKMHSWVQNCSSEAQVIGAVNVVKNDLGTLRGYNTDWIGMSEALKGYGVLLTDNSFLIYGAGGAARAVAYALAHGGAKKIVLTNRTQERAKQLVETLKSHFALTEFEVLPWETLSTSSSVSKKTKAFFNATSIGVVPTQDSLFYFPSEIDPDAFAIDLIYGQRELPFLTQATQKGLKTRNGLDMLIWQAIAAWEIWFGPLEDRQGLKEAVRIGLVRSFRNSIATSYGSISKKLS